MGEYQFVSRCKYGPDKGDDTTHKTVHAMVGDSTYCGKALNDMWYVFGPWEIPPQGVTCRACKKEIAKRT